MSDAGTMHRLAPGPPLKWAGGKRWLVPRLSALWAAHPKARLVEPFCGGLAVALGLRPEASVQNDANPHVINFYRWLQRGLRIDLPMENSEKRFYECRRRFNELIHAGGDDTDEAAALFYYLNRTCYNGLCRFNRSGLFNVPFGRYARVRYVRDFSPYAPILSGWRFTCGDFETVPLRAGDFVYADPPYDVPFTHYARGGFTWADQVRLAEWLSAHDGPVVVSNQATARVETLYRQLGFRLSFVSGPRMISASGDRTAAREMFALKNVGDSPR